MTPRRALAGLLAGALLLACAALAFAATPRTIVVRGRTLAADGRPLANARVMARGTVSVSAVTDERGRYTLSLPLGMAAAVRRLPFRIEVRAEEGGRRLPLVGGGSSLVVDVAWQASAGKARVTSNREAAATAVATALEVEEVALAWIEADFGTDPAPGPDRAFEMHAALPGGPPAAVRAAPRNSTPAGIPKPASTPRNATPRAPEAAKVVPPDSARPGTANPPAPASTGTGTAPTAHPRAAAPRNSAAGPPRPAVPEPPRIVATTRTVEAPPPRPSPVRAIDPFARRDTVPPPDTCRCVLRGTVEIAWARPQEDDTPIRVELDAPGVPPVDLSLYMGAPREFRFPALPCGDWRLTLVSGGKLRYVDEHGDTTRVVPCRGATETRIVLQPVRRQPAPGTAPRPR